jgi:hypothetical protein
MPARNPPYNVDGHTTQTTVTYPTLYPCATSRRVLLLSSSGVTDYRQSNRRNARCLFRLSFTEPTCALLLAGTRGAPPCLAGRYKTFTFFHFATRPCYGRFDMTTITEHYLKRYETRLKLQMEVDALKKIKPRYSICRQRCWRICCIVSPKLSELSNHMRRVRKSVRHLDTSLTARSKSIICEKTNMGEPS